MFGQYIYVNPATRTVIVKLSDYGTEQDEVLTMLAMRSISHVVSSRSKLACRIPMVIKKTPVLQQAAFLIWSDDQREKFK